MILDTKYKLNPNEIVLNKVLRLKVTPYDSRAKRFESHHVVVLVEYVEEKEGGKRTSLRTRRKNKRKKTKEQKDGRR